jgi:carbon monoxide dehydrogenase subunit G
MNLFTTAALLAVLGIAAFLIFVASRPSAFRIERVETVSAPPAAVFALIDDLHNFNRWNPFAQGDPAMTLDYSGPQTGIGAAYAWNSTGRAGQGAMEIVRSVPEREVEMRLQFIRPFAATNIAHFTVTPDGHSSRVVWAMTGHNAFMNKLMGLIMNMDRMVGGEFAKGLKSLKALAEAS